MTEERMQKFAERQTKLQQLSDEELKTRFWELCGQLVDPIVELARTHTSPSIERSVLLRMGVDSITAHAVVERVLDAELLGKGAGHVVLKVSQSCGVDIPAAAKLISEDPQVLTSLFGKGQ